MTTVYPYYNGYIIIWINLHIILVILYNDCSLQFGSGGNKVLYLTHFKC